MRMLSDYEINCLAMAIVNHTNEINEVDVKTRQKNNDKCFDFAIEKIKEALEYKDLSHLFNESPIQKAIRERILNYKVEKDERRETS